jgi:PadR family transcriptional regulator PadR
MKEIKADYIPELLRGNTEALLLFLINQLKNAYGYQLIQEIRTRSRGYFQFKEGTIYPALRKLEKGGLVRGQWQKMSNGAKRRYYRITGKGTEVLRDKIAIWNNFASAMDLVTRPDFSKTI